MTKQTSAGGGQRPDLAAKLNAEICCEDLADRLGLIGSSAASLHAKTFAVDGQHLFVGSFNFDPRSAHLNTELGFLIDSPTLAKQFVHVMDTEVPTLSYRVELNGNGDLQWVGGSNTSAPQIYTVEPHTTWFSRTMVRVLGWLPIEGLL